MHRGRAGAVAALATSTIIFCGARAVHPRTAPGGGELPNQFDTDERLQKPDPDLDARIALMVRRIAAKREAALALIHGELTLSQAADRFRAINGDDPTALDGLRFRHPMATDDELLYRNVIGFTQGLLPESPDPTPNLLDRLRAELAATFPVES